MRGTHLQKDLGGYIAKEGDIGPESENADYLLSDRSFLTASGKLIGLYIINLLDTIHWNFNPS